MIYLVRNLIFFLSFIAASVDTNANGNSPHVSKQLVNLGELSSGRPAKITLWFPTGQCAGLTDYYCLADSAITDRTIVFSHGAMGAAENYNWIGESLAAAGYIVVGVNHYGESWLYGTDTQNVRNTAMVWQRPVDISAIYDALSSRQLFQQRVNWSNVIALGHSSGGQTVAMLAGARYDLSRIINFCKTDKANGDHSCDYGNRNAIKPSEAFLEKFNRNYADSRIKKIIMLDPTLGYGATPESLAKIKRPTLVVGAPNNDFLPWKNHGALYANGIPNANVYLLSGQEGHFAFLDPCENDILVMGVPLCRDRVGVDRTATHAALLPEILKFVAADNILIDPPKQVAEHKKSTAEFQKIKDILIYTPHWVFGLLTGLVILGLMQVRTRKVSKQAVFIMPVAMLVMSLIGTLMNLGFTWITIASWLTGAAIVTAVFLKFLNNSSLSYDQATRKLVLKGSWIPLFVITAIFCTRYAVGMSLGMQLAIVHKFYFAPMMSLILGGLSGYFIAQGFRYFLVLQKATKSFSV